MSVYVGIGSNQQDPIKQVQSAIEEISNLDDLNVIATSSLYRTTPVGPQDQPDFINAVLQCVVNLEPLDFLSKMQAIEHLHGRVRGDVQFDPRTLDLDILLFDDQVLTLEQLTVPHPRMFERAFVLYPLAEISADLTFPDGTLLSQLLSQISPQGVTQLTEEELI